MRTKGRLRAVPDCTSYIGQIDRLLTETCAECHSEERAEGAYRLTRYDEVLGPGSDDVPNAVAGDASSLVLTVLTATSPVEGHRQLSSKTQIMEWVVRCDLEYRGFGIHAGGILNPDDSDFHSHLLRSQNYNFSGCASCHGDDFSGGASEVSCLECHPAGPDACQTCHDIGGPSSGEHALHLNGGDLDKRYVCDACHITPNDWSDPGHILLDGGELDPAPAEVMFGSEARADGADPLYRTETHTCEAVYCHGGSFSDSNAMVSVPSWFDRAPSSGCTSCHGAPPSSHSSNACETCHQQVVPAPETLDTALHLDGVVETGRSGSGCASCHGSEGSAAPPLYLVEDGRPADAHEAHLSAPTGWTNPVACADCHLVPDDADDPGHIDSALPAEVFPESLETRSLAFARETQHRWSDDARTCTSYCHGSGPGAAVDEAASLRRVRAWDPNGLETPRRALCGDCHGIPPSTSPHEASQTLGDCARCHGSVIDANGNFIFGGPNGQESTLHLNGRIDE